MMVFEWHNGERFRRLSHVRLVERVDLGRSLRNTTLHFAGSFFVGNLAQRQALGDFRRGTVRRFRFFCKGKRHKPISGTAFVEFFDIRFHSVHTRELLFECGIRIRTASLPDKEPSP